MAWFYLICAGVLEAVWAVGLKHTNGFTRLIPSIWTLAAMAGSIWLLSLAVRTLPTAIAYAIWTAIGTLLVFLFSVWQGQHTLNALHAVCIVAIVASVLGLKFA